MGNQEPTLGPGEEANPSQIPWLLSKMNGVVVGGMQGW